MLRDAFERHRSQLVLESNHRSLHGELAAAQEVAAMKEPQLARSVGIERIDEQRLACVDRRRANPKAARFRRAHRIGDLFRQRVVDLLALAHDENPVVARRIHGAIQLRVMLRQIVARRDVENELLELREVRRECGEIFRMDVAEGDDRELQRYSSSRS